MLVKQMDEQHIQDIGHAFGYYDYGTEKGMDACFRSPDVVAEYICGFVRCVLADGFLHTTSERGEGYIAYKLPGQKVSFHAAMLLLQGIRRSMSLAEVFRFARSKCEKYMHLGMQLAGTRKFGEFGTMYDLIKYPDPPQKA